jgi:glycolate oxidase FAD binding subunit
VSTTPESEARFLADAVRSAASARRKLRIVGSGSKQFYPAAIEGDVLRVAGYGGIVDYDPAELVLTARAGTPLAEVEQVLAAQGQMLAFEPPQFGGGGTLGGCVATGWSGPRRAYAGAVRDFVIGVQIVDGQGEHLRFGGRVIKNVAGYDVSRLMVGAHGALGVLLEISLRVVPGKHEITRQLSLDEASAIERVNRWAARGLPLSGSCHHAGILTVRLAGAPAVLDRVGKEIGGELVHDAGQYWRSIRDQTAPFFAKARELWRASVPPTAQRLNLSGEQLIEWGGALRWIATDLDAPTLRAEVEARGGHLLLFRSSRAESANQRPALSPGLAKLHVELKRVFDPYAVLNCSPTLET